MGPGHISPPLQILLHTPLSAIATFFRIWVTSKMRIINEHVENTFEHELSMNLGVRTHGEFQKLWCQEHQEIW